MAIHFEDLFITAPGYCASGGRQVEKGCHSLKSSSSLTERK
jgi:hypothetical protein